MVIWNFWSQKPRKSPPAVMFTSRETPCIDPDLFYTRKSQHNIISVIDRHVFFNTPSAKHFSSELSCVTLFSILWPHMIKVNSARHVPRIFESFRLHIHLTCSIVIQKSLMTIHIIHISGVHTNVHEESLITPIRKWRSLGVGWRWWYTKILLNES